MLGTGMRLGVELPVPALFVLLLLLVELLLLPLPLLLLLLLLLEDELLLPLTGNPFLSCAKIKHFY